MAMFGGIVSRGAGGGDKLFQESVPSSVMGTRVALFTVAFSLGYIIGPIGTSNVLDLTGRI